MNSKSLAAGMAVVVATAGLIALASQLTSWRDEYRRPVAVPYPAENAYSPEKAVLGEKLFFDTRLSGSGKFACVTCHEPSIAWTDRRPKAQGAGEKPLAFRSPTLINVAWTETLGWDGKFQTLEEVAFTPINSPANMNSSEALVLSRLKATPEYVQAFAAAFPDGDINKANIEAALATFQRTIVSKVAPFDRYVEGDDTAISAEAKRGFEIFRGKGLCTTCHSGWNFTDGSFHDIGTGGTDNVGRGRLFPTSQKLQYAFKTPTLRDVARRAPYMHDGAMATLEAVVDHYDRGGVDRPSRSPHIRPLKLTARDKADLIAFMETLSSDQDNLQAGLDPLLVPRTITK
jgi:cytochrome c peroxidase